MLKIKFIALALAGSALISACNSSKGTEAGATEMAQGHEHTFACPMHPDVIGKEGDKCPKCGMNLEHNDNAGATNGNTYFMDFLTSPAAVKPFTKVKLVMTPKIKGREEDQVGLDIEHEKKIHLIIVNEDLSYFDHIHPEYTADGSYVVETNFPAGGTYTLFADYKPTGGNHVVDKLTVDVEGNAPAAETYKGDRLTGTAADGFSVTLTPENGQLTTNVPVRLTGVVKQNGAEVDPSVLENYLGAKAHMVVVSLEDKEYLHVHPSVENGRFDLQTTFEKPGVYRAWIQFQSAGKVHTTDFVLNVTAGETTAAVVRNPY